MKKYIPVLVIVLLLSSQGCIMGQDKVTVWQNDKIDPKVKATVTDLNKQVYKSMCDNNYTAVSALFSDTLKYYVSSGFAKDFMPSMQRIMKGHTYRVYDEFYIKTPKRNDTINLSSGKGDGAYTVKFLSPATETYMSLLVAGDSTDEVMLTLTYGLFNGKWLLSNINGEDYSLGKRNAVEQYYYAMALEKKGHLIDAVNIMGMASHCAKPGGRSFTFKKEQEMKTFYDTVTNETKAKYTFPYTVNEVSTKPMVVNIHFEQEQGSFVPMIIYQSVINVLDSSSLTKENDQVQKNIGKIFYGIDKDNKRLLYRAYNELPNGQNQPRYFGFLQTL